MIDNNPKTKFGLAKPPLALVPAPALIQEAEALRFGAEKYGAANWREKPVSFSTYVSAAMRHILSAYDGEDLDPESGVPHLAHARASLGIILDALSAGTLIDDRPKAIPTGELIRALTRRVE